MKISGRQRKGISPIVATVLIIAATLIAFAAVLGYIFGIFGGAASTANVSVTSVSSSVASCGATSPYTCTVDVSLANSGSAGTSIPITAGASDGSLTYAGQSISLTFKSVTPATGTIGAAGSGTSTMALVVTFTSTILPVAGNSFSGSIALANGEQATFTGTFSS